MSAALRHLIRRTITAAHTTGRHVLSAAVSAHHRLLVRLVEAIDTGATVRIAYTDRHGVVSARNITPRRLWASSTGDILVTAHDHRDQDEAHLRTDRMDITTEERDMRLPSTTRRPVPDPSYDPTYVDHHIAACSDTRVTDLNISARYTGATSTDQGATWTPIPMPVPWDSVCGGHVQAEALGALLTGWDVTADGPARTIRERDGSLTRWTPAA
jgi:hypothetical protein